MILCWIPVAYSYLELQLICVGFQLALDPLLCGQARRVSFGKALLLRKPKEFTKQMKIGLR